MDIQESLTNEGVVKKFKSQFDLVNYAISLASQMINSGRAARVDIDNLNPAVVIIEEIAMGRDKLDDVDEKAEPQVNESKAEVSNSKSLTGEEKALGSKPAEKKKKARRILA